MRRAQKRREDVLGLRAPSGAIAAATHFARDHGRPECVLGAPVGGIERWVEEKAEDGVVFSGEMHREASCVGEAARPTREQAPEAIHVRAAGDREAVL